MARYRVFQSETLDDCMESISARLCYEAAHRRAFGFVPHASWLTEWSFTVRRQALLRAPIIWC